MKLSQFRYYDKYRTETNNWFLEKVDLFDVNLVVGKNAVGKSRALAVIRGFANMIKHGRYVYGGEWEFTFRKESDHITYFIDKNTDKSFVEKITYNGKEVAKRDNGSAQLYSFAKKEWQNVAPPENLLMLNARRDTIEYPYFEDIISWCEKVHSFPFGHVHSNSFIESNTQVPNIEDVAELLSKMSSERKTLVLNDFNSLGYNLKTIDSKKRGDKPSLFVLEEFLEKEIQQSSISQGMFRALALLIYVHSLLESKKLTMLLVDDLCEGMDYDRATKLGKLLFYGLIPSHCQLVATSNDSFLMDTVGIQNWNVLHRKGLYVKSYNYINHAELFEKFKYSGLSNFDFFSSDFIPSTINE